jgi:hypothetical protein
MIANLEKYHDGKRLRGPPSTMCADKARKKKLNGATYLAGTTIADKHKLEGWDLSSRSHFSDSLSGVAK